MKHVRCCTIVKKAPAIALLQFVDAIKAVKETYVECLADPECDSLLEWIECQQRN